jgi:hypothetical protein
MGHGFAKYLQGLNYLFVPRPINLHVLGNVIPIMTIEINIKVHWTYDICEPWIKFNNLFSYSSITFFGNNDLNPYKPPSNNY